MKDFDQVVQGLKERRDLHESRRQELTDQKVVVEALDAVQKAIIETTKALISSLGEDIQNVRITNQKDSIKTPDAIKGSETVKGAINELKSAVEGKDIDLMPIVSRLEALERAIGKLPTQYPTFPQMPKEMAVNNLKDVTKCIDELRGDVKKLKLDPRIEVKASDVKVDAPQVNVDLKELKELKKAIEELHIPDTSALIGTLINSTYSVAQEIRSLEFPVPNFRTSDIVDAVTGKSATVPRVEIDTSNSPVIYFGKADPSASTSDAAWQISRGDTTNGLSKSFPNGDTSFSYVWDDRASLSYN